MLRIVNLDLDVFYLWYLTFVINCEEKEQNGKKKKPTYDMMY